MQCHACGHELSGPVAFCPNCGTKPILTPTGGDDLAQQWVADPRNPSDKKATVAMDSSLVDTGMAQEPEAPASAGGSLWIVAAIAVLAGLGAAAYYLLTY